METTDFFKVRGFVIEGSVTEDLYCRPRPLLNDLSAVVGQCYQIYVLTPLETA